MRNKELRFVLITPARNEVRFVAQTIEAVISQTVRPAKWVIVSDGSTDGTDDIVKEYSTGNSWIEFVRMPEHRDRQFAAKVNCFNAGYDRVREFDYHVIGNLDADITFEKEYFRFLMEKFRDDPGLGVAGTPFVEDGNQYDYRFTNIDHVSGACQLFRRECFEDIGGYIPIEGGGIDWTAVTTARMKGWKTRTFTEKVCYHHRKIGTGSNSKVVAWFKHGQKDYFLGGHPLWQFFRSVYQMKSRPYIIGGLSLLLGYLWALILRTKKPVPRDLIQFHRKEQIQRLKKIFNRNFIRMDGGSP